MSLEVITETIPLLVCLVLTDTRTKTDESPTIAILTDEFLDFSAAKGNDLRSAGLTNGCKWCLCVGRWKEAFLAGEGPKDKIIPKYVRASIPQ